MPCGNTNQLSGLSIDIFYTISKFTQDSSLIQLSLLTSLSDSGVSFLILVCGSDQLATPLLLEMYGCMQLDLGIIYTRLSPFLLGLTTQHVHSCSPHYRRRWHCHVCHSPMRETGSIPGIIQSLTLSRTETVHSILKYISPHIAIGSVAQVTHESHICKKSRGSQLQTQVLKWWGLNLPSHTQQCPLDFIQCSLEMVATGIQSVHVSYHQ